MTQKALAKTVTVVTTYTFPFDSDDSVLAAEAEHLKLMLDDPEVDEVLRDEMATACRQIFDRTADRLRRAYRETKGT